jgi:multicomponent Na+:H+ antiporter subunit E
MTLIWKSRLVVFLLSILVWLALTDVKDIQEVVAAVVVAVLVSLIAGHMLITTHKQKHLVIRWVHAVGYFFSFLWEMMKANVHVAYIVLHPLLPIKPGIVKIKTSLTKETALTVLTNSITLTPGTLTVDINPDQGEIYIHWIDVKATEVDKCTAMIGARFERTLKEVFE